MRGIIDTNVLVSGIISRFPDSSNAGRIVSNLIEGSFTLILSLELFNEFQFVISRSKFNHLITAAQINETIRFLRSNAEWAAPVKRVTVCRDIKDNFILECALFSIPDVVVSGDGDLLELKTFCNVPIIRPAEFIKMLAL